MNIYDIARLAGVSIATVSRVVNDSPKVSEKTKQKVRAVMEEQNLHAECICTGTGIKFHENCGDCLSRCVGRLYGRIGCLFGEAFPGLWV